MKERTSQILFAYWNAVRRDRPAPLRFEIEPSRIAGLLPNTFILERNSIESYRFRLAGTRICDDMGAELRGTNFLDGWNDQDRITLERQLSVIAQKYAAGVFTMVASTNDQREAAFEVLVLPLVHTRQTVDRFLGSITAISPPEWLGSSPLSTRRLATADLVWPSGKPEAFDRSHRQPPFSPLVRTARIVSDDRRQFRVYDGGLSKPSVEKS